MPRTVACSPCFRATKKVTGGGGGGRAGARTRVILLGCGRIAQYFHLQALAGWGDVELVAVPDPDPGARAATAAPALGIDALELADPVLPLAAGFGRLFGGLAVLLVAGSLAYVAAAAFGAPALAVRAAPAGHRAAWAPDRAGRAGRAARSARVHR